MNMLKKYQLLLATCIVLLACVPGVSKAEDKRIIHAVMTHLPPFMIVGDNGVEDCINARILDEILKPLNLKVVYDIAPFKRCLLYMQTGQADIFFGILKNAEREAYMHYVEPPYKTSTAKAFYIRKGTGIHIGQYEDLYSLNGSIGTRLGFSYFPRFDADARIKKEPLGSDQDHFRLLAHKRLDAVIITETVGDYLILKDGYHDKIEKAAYKYDQLNPAYLAISKKSPYMQQIREFETIIQQLRDSGRIQGIIDNFISEMENKY